MLVTRGEEKEDRLRALLADAGATVVGVPMIAVEPLAAAARLPGALATLRGADRAWVVLTSATGVRVLAEHAGGAAHLGGLAWAVVGPATEAALRVLGVTADVVAPGQIAESLAEQLVARGVQRARVLVVAAGGGRDVVAPALRAAGAEVDVIEAYRSVMPDGAAALLRAALETTPPDAVTFTSGSTVRHFGQALSGRSLPSCPAVCIGPITARMANQAGWVTVVTAPEHTAEGVASATVRTLGHKRLP